MTAIERTGIRHLDTLLGAIPRHSAVALLNDPGVEAEPFLYHAVTARAADERAVVYVTLNRAPSSILASLRAYGLEAAGSGRAPHFVDGFSPLVGASEQAAYEVADLRSPAALVAALSRAAEDHPEALLVVDGLSTLLDMAPQAEPQFGALQAAMRRFPLSLALITRWPYGSSLGSLTDGFDALVALRGVEERVISSQYFAVERTAWPGSVHGRRLLYKAVKPVGVLVYVPKIVVTGAYHAGKSTLVGSMSDVAISVNRMGTTVALDHGRVTLDGFTADIFGTPGQSRFDPLLRVITGHSLGIVVAVDSADPSSFERAREMLGMTWKKGVPMVVAANKQDAPGALSPSEVARLLAPPEGVEVVGCVGSDPASARAVLRRLLDHVLTGSVAA